MRLTKYSGVAKSEIAQPPVMAPLLEPREPQARSILRARRWEISLGTHLERVPVLAHNPVTLPRSANNFDTVRTIGRAFPGVQESTAYGAPALKVQGKLLACLPTHRSAEPDSLMVRVGFDDRAELLAEAPDVYYVTDHYAGYNAVLVRLHRVNPDVLRDLLGMAYKFVTAKSPSRSRSQPRKVRSKKK